MSRLSVGIDVGGTFTDLVAIDETGAPTAAKVLSTPGEQSGGVMAALQAFGRAPKSVARIVHGTTVATNTLLERNGARVALCATAGVEDLLALRRQDRASLYDLSRHHPSPLVAEGDTIAVVERMTPAGIAQPLGRLDDVVARLREIEPDIVAVSLLHSYADPVHERRLASSIRQARPALDVVLSSDVLPQIREYERTSTTVAEAYLRPVVAGYLDALAGRLAGEGYRAPAVMTSSGGVRQIDDAARSAASLALSGPAGGVVGAALAAAAAGIDRALTIDIGGTSADVGLVVRGDALVEMGGSVAGVPIALPRVLVDTVSAGGGSIAWIDEGGALRVGPRSAGIRPGPVAFGRGGSQPTVTDAHVALGHIAGARLGTEITLDVAAARGAIAALADRLGASPERVARAIIATADASMARALRRVSVERGIDPRACVLIAFGGGGPLHGCGLAAQLGVTRVLVPPYAGVLSALGLAATAEQRETLVSVMERQDRLDAGGVAGIVERLGARSAAPQPGERIDLWAHARYAGQGHELDVAIAGGDDGAALAARFAGVHQARFGFTLDRPVEVVSARMTVSRGGFEVALQRRGTSGWRDESRIDDGRCLDATVEGPASVTLPDATMLIAGGWGGRALPSGGWLLEAT